MDKAASGKYGKKHQDDDKPNNFHEKHPKSGAPGDCRNHQKTSKLYLSFISAGNEAQTRLFHTPHPLGMVAIPRGVLCHTSAEGSPTPSGGNDNPLFYSFFYIFFFFLFLFFYFFLREGIKKCVSIPSRVGR